MGPASPSSRERTGADVTVDGAEKPSECAERRGREREAARPKQRGSGFGGVAHYLPGAS